MTSYITAVNQLIAAEVAQISHAVVYGENINCGSHISGLTRNLKTLASSRILNIGNCEYTHCGVGFGLMLNGATAVLFVKQLDFMLLGVDHFVSTYNAIRCHREPSTLGSFTIVAVAYDQGFQGPQSSFNALGDMCSMARVPGYTLTNNQDSAHVLRTQLRQPGFRFIVLSQRLSPKEFLQVELVYAAEDSSVFQYTEGEEVTIVCFNFTVPEGYILCQKLQEQGLTSSLFSANPVLPKSWERIKQSAAHTGRLVVLDDSKSINLLGYSLLHEVSQASPECRRWIVTREENISFGVCPDYLLIDYEYLIAQLRA